MEDILAIIFIFGGATLGLLAFSPIGRAFADRIRGRAAAGGGEETAAELAELREMLTTELQDVRREVSELAERLDFAERLLAQHQREPGRIAPGGERARG